MSEMKSEGPEASLDGNTVESETTNPQDGNRFKSEDPRPKPAPGRLPARATRD